MVAIIPCGRILSKQLPIRSAILTRLVSTSANTRVTLPQTQSASLQKDSSAAKLYRATPQTLRGYATASTKTASKPKAHTGRAPAKGTTKKSTTKTKAKPKAKKTTKKAKPKPKAKKVKKAPSKTAVLQKERATRTALRQRAAIGADPKTLPEQAWPIYVSQNSARGQKATDNIKAVAASYKRIAPEEREALNHTANQNKAKNATAYKQWISTMTPAQVRDINLARHVLLRNAKANKVKHLAPFRPLKDDRLPKGARSAYTYFFKDRIDSGDFKGMTIKESAQLVAREWKALSAAQAKQYNDLAAQDRARYDMEYKTVYGVETPSARKRATAAANA